MIISRVPIGSPVVDLPDVLWPSIDHRWTSLRHLSKMATWSSMIHSPACSNPRMDSKPFPFLRPK